MINRTPATPYNQARKKVAETLTGATLIDTTQWTRLREVDVVARMWNVSRAVAVERIVNEWLSYGTRR